MKKILVILISTIMVIFTSSMGFATSEQSPEPLIRLGMTTMQKEVRFINEYQGNKVSLGNDSLESLKKENNINLEFTKINEQREYGRDIVILSGDGYAELFGNVYHFTFENKQLDVKYANSSKLYTGCIEVEINEDYMALLDITSLDDFSKSVISFTLTNQNNDEQQVMLYGDTFDEQKSLFQQELEAAEKELQNLENNEEIVDEQEDSDIVSTRASVTPGSAYQHVSNKSNSYLGGATRDKQMMVMSISKCDPKNFGSGSHGFEMIRVFSRSYNAKTINYSSPILLAKPNKVKVLFEGDKNNLMAVTAIKPSSGNGALSNIFKVFNSVAGANASGLLASVSAAISSLPIQIGDTVTKSGTNATFDMSINVNASDMDLPAATTSTNAGKDTKHGLTFKVSYQQEPGNKTADITVRSAITYRMFLNTDRTVSLTTGKSVISHKANLN